MQGSRKTAAGKTRTRLSKHLEGRALGTKLKSTKNFSGLVIFFAGDHFRESAGKRLPIRGARRFSGIIW
jgi:hypothetical protein